MKKHSTTHLRLLILTVFLSIYSLSGLSAQQTYSVEGKITDVSSGETLPGANVILTNVKDTAAVHAAVADVDGNFLISNLENAFYKLKISFVGYKTTTKFVRVNKERTMIGTITMEEDPQLLKEVEIEGTTITAVLKGDTTQYNAKAFQTNPDANAEDLITKMPGIIVDESGVQAQGEQVQKVLVDGREFFGNDPNVALKSIPAEIIDKIEVFDQLSDQSQFSGFDDGNTTKTLNIVTKPEARQGRFGRVYAGYGTDDLYNAGGNINEFENDRRISVVGMANNINQQNFADEDIAGVASSSGDRRRGRGGGRGGGDRGGFNASGNASDFIAGQQSGITTTGSLGINYSNKWDKLTLNGSYFYNKTDNSNDQLLARETFLTADTSQFYDEISNSATVNYNHRINLRMQYEIDERNSLIFTPSLSLQQNDQIDALIGINTLSEELQLSETTNLFDSKVTGFNQSGTLLYRHRFEARGRTFSVRLRNNIRNTDNDSDLFAITNDLGQNLRSDSTDQFTLSESDSRTWSTNLTYTEPIGQSTQMQFNYNYSVTNSDSDTKTFDDPTEEDDIAVLNTELSNEFTNKYITHRPTIGIRHRKDKLMIRAGLSYQNASLQSDQLFPITAQVDQSFNNMLPDAMIMYRFSREKNLRIIYRTRTANPSVTQLQNVIDNSNPLFLSTGNPNLEQSYSHTLVTRYGNANVDKSINFFTFIYAGLTSNEVANATTLVSRDSVLADGIVLPAGGQLTSPVNVDGAWNLRSFTTLGLPFGLLKSNINLNLTLNYNRTPGLVNNLENISNTFSTSSGFVIGSNISEKLDFTIKYTAGYTIVENSIQPTLNDNYLTQTSQLNLNWIFHKGLVFRSDISHQLYSGLSEDFNQDFFLWNMSVGKKILKEQRGEIRLDIFDLLNQNNNISRTTTETYIEDVINQAIRQYFMLSFTYNIRDFGKKNGST
ncbi:MAG: TonB-dependent receptor [Cyclobacteriaceae bacterium]